MSDFLLVSSLAVSSTLSAITTKQTTTSSTTTVIIQLISISLITRLPILNKKKRTEEYSTRILLRHTIPTALLTLIIDCSRNHITQQLNTRTWQAFDIYALPITLLALSKLPSIIKQQPSLELVATISITSFAISILFLAEPLQPSLILLALISPTSHALYLIHLKTCLLSFPNRNPTVPLANASPIALILILIPTTLKAIHSSPDSSISVSPTTHTLATILYLISRISERLLELYTLSRFKSPLSLLLIIPLRNLLSIIIAELSSSSSSTLSIGRLGSPQSFACYSFSLFALYHAQPDVPRAFRKFFHLALNKLSSLKLAILSSESSSYHYANENGEQEGEEDDDDDEEEEEEEEKEDQDEEDKQGSPLQEKSSSAGEAQELIRHRSNSVQINPQPPPSRYIKPSPSHRYSRTDDSPRLTNRWKRVLRIISFGPLVVLFLINCVTRRPLYGVPLTELSNEVGTARPTGSVDLVFSYYNEPLSRFYEAVDHVRRVSVLSRQHPRVIVYVKHPTVSLEKIAKVIQADEVVRLENVGREGGTYLTHILRHYNATRLYDRSGRLVRDGQGTDPWVLSQPQFGLERLAANSPSSSPLLGLADFTVFMQPEISWHWIAKPRMDLFDPQSTGFLSFGPYLVSVCGQDGLGNGNYERMRDIYTLFYNSFCPPTGQLASYAGQFVVSKRRILGNGYVQYSNMRALLEAGQEHWIHGEGGWLKWKGATDTDPGATPNGPQAPFLGHALERSWPVVFHCFDPAIAELCPDNVNVKDRCQCFD